MEVIKNLEVKPDHIGLYPRAGKAAKDNHTSLLYRLTIPEGTGTMAVSADHPLTAPVKKQLRDGAPGGSWRYIAAKLHDKHYVLGSVNLSIGKRLLFFPSNYHVEVSSGNGTKHLDHVSLESRTKLHSHFTFRDATHLANGKIKQVTDTLYLWFSLFVSKLDHYIPLPNQLNFSLDWPASDMGRFSKDGVLANYCSKSIVEVTPIVKSGPSVYQLDFFIAFDDLGATDVPNIAYEDYQFPEQPNPTISGFSVTQLENYSLILRVTERSSEVEVDSLIISTQLE